MEKTKKIMNCDEEKINSVIRLKGEKKFDLYLIPEKYIEYKETYDLETAKWLLELISVTYSEDETKIKNALSEKTNLKFYTFYNIDDAEAGIYYNDDLIVVVFCGTSLSDIKDILCDLNIFHEKVDYGNIHKGFFEYYKKLRKTVFQDLLKLKREKNRKIIWTGHSMGGALAVIFCSIFREGIVYTFGSPKTGDAKFAEFCNNNLIHFRIYNENDLIPKLPPINFLYEHSGIDVLFREKRIIKIFKYINNIVYFIIILILRITNKNALIFLKSLNYIINSLQSHSVSKYREALWTNKYDCFIKIN